MTTHGWEISNGSQDIWITDSNESDSDNGGVIDRQGKFDFTNPKKIQDDIFPMTSTATDSRRS
ncbi:MAG: hypothetical protein CM15mP71_4780 [Candidatus Poseidoniales archaeon]|nr:MAG: hypothetical protein CM15mP71_4780 [Candidatus Poseidoniales archaeon]